MVRLAIHERVAKFAKLILGKYLGEHVGNIVVGRHIYKLNDVFVTKCLHPFLSAINMLELGTVARAIGKRYGRCVVYSEINCVRKLHVEFTCHI